MRLEVIEGNQRNLASKRHRLGDCKPHGDTTNKPGTRRDGDCIKLSNLEPGFIKRSLDNAVNELRMGPCRNLRNNATIGAMRIELTGHDVGQDTARTGHSPADHRSSRFVAACLNAQYSQHDRANRFIAWNFWRSLAILYSLRANSQPLSLELASVQTPIRIGTRGSPLALAQTRLVIDALSSALGWAPDEAAAKTRIVPVKTSGDRIQDRPLADVGGKGLFAKELEEALLREEIDCAVHSLKDMPTLLPEGLVLDCMLQREDPTDALICKMATTIDGLPPRARFATGSVRRQALILNRRPDLQILPLRGNVDTRLARIVDNEADATLLATAGLKRLRKSPRDFHVLPATEFLPAVAQGAIGIEARASSHALRELLERINDPATRITVSLEREFLSVLDGSCKTPIAGYARQSGDGRMHFDGCALSPDGQIRFDVTRTDTVKSLAQAIGLGRSAGEELLARAGKKFFQV